MSDSNQAAKRLGLEQTENGYSLSRSSLLDSVGGPLGIAEAIVPAFAFSIAFAFTSSALTAVSIAVSLSVMFITVRLVQRKALTQALIGMAAVALAAFLALREGGSAADYFLPGLITNATYGSVLLLSVLLGRPILGYVGQLIFGLQGWRENRLLKRRFQAITLVWVGFFSARLLVQVPLYLAQEVEALAIARAIMGAPAYAALLALSWVLMRNLAPSKAVD
jgi:hypothetical protein